MNISIVTPHAVYNYGAVLQAHGLYNYLTEQGHEVYMQDFPPHKGKPSKSLKGKVYGVLSAFFGRIHRKKLGQAAKSFDEFISGFALTTAVDMPMYIVGSDQVWNPANLDEHFSLRFASEKSKKISYAASIGVNKIPYEVENEFRETLSRLQSISVREEQAKNEVVRISSRECSVDCDPVFLLSKEAWQLREKSMSIKEPYVLLYLLHVPKNIGKIVRKVKKQYGCKALLIDRTGFLHHFVRGVKPIYNAGPQEFLWLIHHAQAVLTSSFHGTAFSIIYQKQFLSIVNPASPSRIKHLLDTIGLQKRGIYSEDNLDFSEIDYTQAGNKLKDYIDKSKEYLRVAIGEN